MSARAEGEVGGVRSRRHEPVAVVHCLLLRLVRIGDVFPAVGIPQLGLGEKRIALAHRRGGGEQDVRGRDHPFGPGDGQRVLDFPHDGMDGRVQAQGLLDHVFGQR